MPARTLPQHTILANFTRPLIADRTLPTAPALGVAVKRHWGDTLAGNGGAKTVLSAVRELVGWYEDSLDTHHNGTVSCGPLSPSLFGPAVVYVSKLLHRVKAAPCARRNQSSGGRVSFAIIIDLLQRGYLS